MKSKRTFYPCLPPPAPVVLASFRQALKGRPESVPLRLQRVERKVFRDYIREKVVFDVERGLSSVAWVCRPRAQGRWPGVLCCHGAGPGKDPLVGLINSEPCLEYHKLVAVRLAQRGYVTIAPDRRGFGERAAVPYCPLSDRYRAELEEFYRRTRHTSLLALDIWDGVRTLDVLAEYADAKRIGCMGVYDGATVAAGVAAFDQRIKAVSLACFSGDAALCRRISPRPVQIQIAKAWPTMPRGLLPGNVHRHVFDGVLELDFPPLATWLERYLK